jgi:hypothetical protein
MTIGGAKMLSALRAFIAVMALRPATRTESHRFTQAHSGLSPVKRLLAVLFALDIELQTAGANVQGGGETDCNPAFPQLWHIALSGTSGLRLPTDGPQPDVDPAARIAIDPDGVTLCTMHGGVSPRHVRQ